MKTLKLQRVSYRRDCTLGVLYDAQGDIMCATLEEPDMDNFPKASCIPEGQYTCTPHNGTKFKQVWELKNVKNRSAILIHAGNTTDDTEGCILLGRTFGKLKGKPAVIQSQSALAGLRAHIGTENEFIIQIERI